MNKRVRTIAAHEYITNVRRKEFILMTLGLPLLFLVIIGISMLGAGAVIRSVVGKTHTLGIIDRSGALDLRAVNESRGGFRIAQYKDEAAGQADVRSGKITELVVVGPDYLSTGKVTTYRKGGGLFSEGSRAPVEAILTRALLARGGTDPRLADRAVNPVSGSAPGYVLDKNGKFVPEAVEREIAKFAVPYAFMILLFTAIFVSANYLLRGISDEKENRVIEVILSSVTAEELLKGKLIGLAGVGLTQVGVWVALAAVPAMLAFSKVVHLSALTLVEVVVFFGLGFGLYATLMAGLGALGTSYRESQQMSGAVSMFAVIPMMLITAILNEPNGTIARVFSFVPFTSPITMVLRVTATDVPFTDVLISAALIAATTWLLLKLSAKLFRFGLLIYGKRPSFGETWKWLRQA
jgi:ABC-2 type transport system permease protein